MYIFVIHPEHNGIFEFRSSISDLTLIVAFAIAA